jgi:DNA-binding Lrp family transcriptional regulator
MAMAYVLVNTELGSESSVETDLHNIDGVKEVYSVYGVYDLVVKLETESMKELKNIITNKIRKIKNVRSSLTLITF